MGKRKTRKSYLGGTSSIDLAYTGKQIPTQSNPFLSYTGKGGSNIPQNINTNINAKNPAMPNTGPPFLQTGTPIWNQASPQKGGTCGVGCSINPATIMLGGSCSSCSLGLGFMVGGVRHRSGCKCSKCKRKNKGMKGGNQGIPYPNGLVGKSFNPGNVNSWPGVNGIPGDNNHFAQNMYLNDPQTAMKSSSFSGGKSRTRRQKGGNFSNFIAQDLINLGRQFQFGIGSAYNALAGYSSPVNPLPWKDQFPNSNNAINRLSKI